MTCLVAAAGVDMSDDVDLRRRRLVGRSSRLLEVCIWLGAASVGCLLRSVSTRGGGASRALCLVREWTALRLLLRSTFYFIFSIFYQFD